MPTRFVAPAALVVLAAALAALAPAQDARSIYRDGFAGREPSFVKGDANVKFVEKDHKISNEHGKSGLTSEYVKIESTPPAGAAETQFVHYYYETPPAPVTERLTASVWVKAFRPGIQVKARVVFPKEKDPRNPDAPLTALIAGKTYEKVRMWDVLGFGNVSEALAKQLPVLHARLGRAVDRTDAYIDRIVLNVHAGAGVTEVWIDDLEIGPVRTDVAPPQPKRAPPGGLASRPKAKGRKVEFDGQVLVEGDDGVLEPFFMLAIRHGGAPLKTLRDARFNTVWFPDDAPQATVDEAIRHGFWIVPTLPLGAGEWDARQPKRPDRADLEKEADRLAAYLRKFLAGDAVLMWSLGESRTAEDVLRVRQASDYLRSWDPRRPTAVDLWDGFSAFAPYVDAIGAHRWPLFSGLEMVQYREWLAQRRALIPPGKMTWTWVQTHLPSWLAELVCGQPDPTSFAEPIGPHPEQIRVLTYLSLAAGHKGLGFWSDKYLDTLTHGRDRFLELALLNTEIDLLKPVLFAAESPARWIGTSHPNVQAAVLAGSRETLVLPVWLGPGTQYTPAQATVPALTVIVPNVPDGATPWQVTPAGITEIKEVQRVHGGTQIVVREFDTTAAVVFTSDLGPTGKIVRWQDATRCAAPLVARYAQQQAIEQFHKARRTHARILEAGGPDLPPGEADELFRQADQSIRQARVYADNNQYDVAYREARRALRPLRALMRADWEKATETLDTPTAAPFAVSFYTLPEHWKMARELHAARPAGNGFPNGGFELSRPAPATGADVSSLPGWKVRKMLLTSEPAVGIAAIVNVKEPIPDTPPKPPELGVGRYGAQRVAAQPVDFRQPEFGRHCLTLAIRYKGETNRQGQALPPPQALERAVVAVDSPAADFAPGSLVRVSFWAKVPGALQATADGLVVFDTAGGEPLGVRVLATGGWKQYHLYRRVPPSGKLAMTFALTGFGVAYIDDVRIEPLAPFTPVAGDPPVARTARPDAAVRPAAATVPAGGANAVRPAAYRR
jgi:hypothetical protein